MRIRNQHDKHTSFTLEPVRGTNGGATIVNSSGTGDYTHMLVGDAICGRRAIVPVDRSSNEVYVQRTTPNGGVLFFPGRLTDLSLA